MVEQTRQGRVALVLAQFGPELLDQQPVLVRVGRVALAFQRLQQLRKADEGQQFVGNGEPDDGVHEDTR
jgi:hypothetical protein